MAEETENKKTENKKTEDKKTEDKEALKAQPKSNTLMIVAIGALVFIVILIGILVAVLIGKDDHNTHESPAPTTHGTPANVDQHDAHQEQKPKSPSEATRKLSEIGTIHPLEILVVNLKSDNGRRYLKTLISLEITDPKLSIELTLKNAVIRDKIIRILSSKSVEEVASTKGKQTLVDQITVALNSMLDTKSINSIYFTEFVVQ